MRWQEFPSPEGSGPWPGLDLVVERGDLVRGAPILRVRARARRIRIERAGEPVLWARVHRTHHGLWILLSRRCDSWEIVPPITSRAIDAIDAAPRSEAWWRAWSRWFARELTASPMTPLHPGRWALTAAQAAGDRQSSWGSSRGGIGLIHDVRTCLDAPLLRWESWWLNGSGALTRLRSVSPDAARVRAYRKRARDGSLPPVLVQFVSGLDMFVLLDGHDRLRASLLEGFAPPLLVLWRVRAYRILPDPARQAAVMREVERKRLLRGERERPLDVDTENKLLIAAFDDRDDLWPKTSAWPLERDAARWDQQILAEGVAPDHLIFSGEAPPD